MKFLISGASGLIGTALINFLSAEHHEVHRLVRRRANRDGREIFWDPMAEVLNSEEIEGFDVIVHLAGENIASRWTEEQKAKIRDSRINGTRTLRNAIAELEQPPKVFVSASAVGYYGDRGDEVLTEESEAGTGFLADVCREWEAITVPVTQKGVRVVNPRFGLVLSADGGALQKMLTPFRMGAGGIVGDGKQFWSWIALDDLVGIIHHAVVTESLRGPVNAVAADPVRNYEFTKTLGRVLGRPTIFPLPSFAARLAFGEMANELLLGSARVEPAKLSASGYTYRFPELEGALRHILRKK